MRRGHKLLFCQYVQRCRLQHIAVEDGDLTDPDPRQCKQDRTGRTAGADHHHRRAFERHVGDRRVEAAGIRVGADDRAILSP